MQSSDDSDKEVIGGNLGARPAEMKFGMAIDSGRSRPNILGWFAGIGQAAQHLLRLKHPPSIGNRTESVVVEAEAGHAASDNADASCTTALTVDANISPVTIDGVSQAVPDAQEIDRRRNLVRTLFNDFWSGAHDKPAAFVQRLDQAEDYLNDRLATNGEFWRLDANTRAILGLPPRSSSAN